MYLKTSQYRLNMAIFSIGKKNAGLQILLIKDYYPKLIAFLPIKYDQIISYGILFFKAKNIQ